jgi:hypothetical protein
MNLSLPSLRTLTVDSRLVGEDDSAHVRRLWSLVSLLAVYATALVVVLFVSEGPDLGCILMGIAGHVVYASARLAASWRDASFMDAARARVYARRRLRRAHA